MMTIKHKRDLPKWFDLKKYQFSNNLDASGWLEQLTIRRHLEYRIKENLARVDVFLDLLTDIPKLDSTAHPFMKILLSSGALDAISEGGDSSKYAWGVHSMTVREYFQLQMNFDDEKGVYAANFFEQLNSDIFQEGGLKYKFKDWIDQPVDAVVEKSNSLTLSVNMNLPDKILLQQFDTLIKSMRGTYQKVDNNQKFDAHGFVKFGVLPYLDLKLWSLKNKIKIPNRVLSEAIYPEGEGGEEVLRKTTKSMAEKVMKDVFLEKLQAIAVQEKAERNKR